ncbi:Protein SIP5 [Rhynchospora pubera]|uniref:Protein SIP5 n=1 Tax=Rhynchospora pubera TaxID=906938 RepID=A0AAV8CTW3_9POAL|nr:Protein SIP5 [Rhynchospora pubera]
MGNKLCGVRRHLVEDRLTRPPRQLIRQPPDVDYKRIRDLIRSRKLAPFFDASEDQGSGKYLEECPICFLYYPSLNRSRCCAKGICTECFLRMMPSDPTKPVYCPFCKAASYGVYYRGAKTTEERHRELEEERKVIEARKRIQYEFNISNQVLSQPNNIASLHNGIEFLDNNTSSLLLENRMEDCSLNTSCNSFRKDLYIDLEDLLVSEAIWQFFQDSDPCFSGIGPERQTHEENEVTRESAEKDQILNLWLALFS